MLPEFTQFASGILEAWVNEDGDEVITYRSFNYHMLTIKAFVRKALEDLVATLWTPEQFEGAKDFIHGASGLDANHNCRPSHYLPRHQVV